MPAPKCFTQKDRPRLGLQSRDPLSVSGNENHLGQAEEPTGKSRGRTASEKLRTDRHQTRLDSWKTKTEGKQLNLSRRKIRSKISDRWSTLAAQKTKTEDSGTSLQVPSDCKQKKDSRAVSKINRSTIPHTSYEQD
jgi:hypothetical protein